MILKPTHKNFKGQLQIKETVKKNVKSGAICPCQGFLNDITYFEVVLNW
jgi:hypothetical protein